MAYLDGITLEHTIGIYEETLKIAHSPVDSLTLEFLKELKSYKDAEEQGLLLRLPCKYNDDLYWIANGYAQKVWFKGIRCDKGFKPQIIATYIDGSTLNSKETPITLLENIGKTVFLTKEEAEQKLASMQKG